MSKLPPLPKGLLFDLDDTILTYDAIGREMWRKTAGAFANRVGCEPERLLEMIEETRHWFWSDPERNRQGRLRLDEARIEIVALSLQRLGIVDRALAAAIAEYFRVHRNAAIDFFPGAQETLEELRRRGCRLALVTNGQKRHQRAKILRFGLQRYFDVICIEEEVGVGKPEPQIFEAALRGLKLQPEEAWMIGDDLHGDIAGAQRVGLFTVWHDYRRQGLPAETPIVPEAIIHMLPELLATAAS